MQHTTINCLIAPDSPCQRLDVFLCQAFENTYSRSWIAQQIKAYGASLNGIRTTKPSTPVGPGMHILFALTPPPCFELEPKPVPFTVIAEEKDFLIINKPAGLAVHYAPSAPEALTLVHGLLHRYPEFAAFEEHERPGIVHRLDKDTSGIMIVARNKPAQAAIGHLFHERHMHKTYHALVTGHPDKESICNLPIGRDPQHRHKMTIKGIAPRNAKTGFSVITYYQEPYTLISAHPLTGRTHQIRVHSAVLGHPLVGDATYGSPSPLIARHALHAVSLSFAYKERSYLFTAPYADDFAHALTILTPNTPDS